MVIIRLGVNENDRREPASISIDPKLLELIDKRAASLGLNRSQYLCAIAMKDIQEGGPLTLYPRGERESSEAGSISAQD